MGFRFTWRSSSRNRKQGRVGATIGGAIFATLGGLFLLFLTFELIEAIDQRLNWHQVDATVIRSRIDTDGDNENPYQVYVVYQFTFKGKQQITPEQSIKEFGDYDEAEKLFRQYAQGNTVQCWVNPDDVTQSVLERTSFMIVPFMLLPLTFLVVGVGLIYHTWRKPRDATLGEKGEATTVAKTARKAQRDKRLAVVLPIGFFALFAIIGTALTWFLYIKPQLLSREAQHWTPTPCVIERSAVQTHRGDDGNTYSIDILFRYEVDGTTYRSNQYDFSVGSSSGRSAKARVVRKFPEGSKATCYVDPDDPDRAVIQRDVSWLNIGLLGVAFALVGYGGMIGFAAHHLRRSMNISHRAEHASREESTLFSSDWLPDFTNVGPMRLKPKHSRFAKVAGALAFAVVWNGLISVFIYFAIAESDWCLRIFMIPFVLVGVFLIFNVFKQLLALRNPRVLLTINNDAIPAGETLDLTWDLAGGVHRVKQLTIELVCTEHATYTRGTDSVTDTEIVFTQSLVDTDQPSNIIGGMISYSLPSDLMHSFTANHNKVLWTVNVQGVIHRWPDVKNEYPLVVLPADVEGGMR